MDELSVSERRHREIYFFHVALGRWVQSVVLADHLDGDHQGWACDTAAKLTLGRNETSSLGSLLRPGGLPEWMAAH